MGKILVIAEKPAAGKSMAKILDCKERKDGFMEGRQYIVTWAVGHLIGLKYPEEHDMRFKEWRIEDLPFSFEISDSLKVLPATKKQFQIIKKLIQREDVDMLINAGDAGREGYLIQSWIYRMAGNRKPIKVLWASSLTDEALRKAFENLKENNEFQSLLQEAEARAEGDHKLGINYSRVLSLLLADENTSLSYGRCQTPLLNLIANREKEIQIFKPQQYFNLEVTYKKGFKGILVSDKKDRIDFSEKDKAQVIIKECEKSEGSIQSYSTEEKRQSAPLLLDLATLQKKMGAAYGFTMDYTLQIAQSLYEKYKVLSYPRTDSRYLSNDLYGEIKEHLMSCNFGVFKGIMTKIQPNDKMPDKQYFNDKKVTDHHALIPNIHEDMEATYTKMTADEKRVFDAVIFSLIAIFYPDYQYSVTEIMVDIKGYLFISTGKTIRSLGYKEIYKLEDDKKDNEDKQILPELTQGSNIKTDELEILDKMTKPPKRYTVSSIVTLMEKYRIGTPATRAEIVKKLQNPKRQFIELNQGKYIPTKMGEEYIDLLPEKLKDPDLTFHFEEKLARINAGDLKKEEFLNGLDEDIRKTIEELKSTCNQKIKRPEREKIPCPICGMGYVIATQKSCFCSEYKNTGCTLTIWSVIAGKKLTDKQIIQLLTKGKTAKIKGFQGKKGEFETALELNEEGKVTFSF